MSRVVPPGDPGSLTDWRRGLPELTGQLAIVREVQPADAPALFALLATDEVGRFISPPPGTLRGFERFIASMRIRRAEGDFACFAVQPVGVDAAVGVIQVRALERNFDTAEWGFAIGSPFWGTGLFPEAASLVMAFAFGTLGVHRLEARAAVINARGNRALRKIGATCEGILRRSFRRNGQALDQNLWAILDSDRLPNRWH
jgi:[ribosomal protein S5]-alanine N-acetyltransferase